MQRDIRKTLICILASSVAALASAQSAVADNPSSSPPAAAPKLPPDLPKRIREITDVVLKHHIDPPARQQMILSGIKALYQTAGVPAPAGLGRRVSELVTPEHLAGFLAEAWPKATAKPVDAGMLEEAVIHGLLESVPGTAHLVLAKDQAANEQFEGNRYVGIHIALGMDDQEKRPKMFEVWEGGPADRAGAKKDDLIEQIDGVDTKGMTLRQALDRLRGAEGTDVTIQVRQPKAQQSRTMTMTRGQLPRTTVRGVRKRSAGGWDVRLDGPDPIGYLHITDILASTPHELRKWARQLDSEGIRALVLDLRGLQATSLHPTVILADALLDRGSIGRVRTLQGETTYQADPDALFRGWPLVVLVDFTTSGTAEWLAAALQDNRRAVLVGTPTTSSKTVPGEAVVRSTVPVGDGAWSVTLVTGCLQRGDGRSLSLFGRSLVALMPDERKKVGVHPDHAIDEDSRGRAVLMAPVRLPQEPISANDPALRKAIQLLGSSLKTAARR